MTYRIGEVRSEGKPGQGLVEFALVLPVLLIIAIGLFDLGRAFFSLVTVTNASREGARYLTLHPDDRGNIDGGGNRYAGTREVAAREALGTFVTLTPNDVTVLLCIDSNGDLSCDIGTPVRVRVTYIFRPIFGGIFPVTLDISRETEMMVP